MRIGMLAPLGARVPPVAYGGTQLVVSLLTEELVHRGHDVTLFASGDSETDAVLESVHPRSLRDRDEGRGDGMLQLLNAAACFERAKEFQIIHDHTSFEGLSLVGLIDTPVLTTVHHVPSPDWHLILRHSRGWYNTVSRSARSMVQCDRRFAGVIYNAIDTSSYPFNDGPRDDYMLFLSRIRREKGPHLAIEVAQRLERPLVIAGNVDEEDRQFFEDEVLPYVDGDLVRYAGEVGYTEKRTLLSEATCLLAPVTWEEPFGMFLVEASACGTPVVAFRRGSIPEVVADGVNGYVVDTVDEMARAAGHVDRIDPAGAREYVERTFGVDRMVDGYLAAYERIIDEYRPAG